VTLGRLFWKFFAFGALAQVGGFIAIAMLFWLTQPRADREDVRRDAGAPMMSLAPGASREGPREDPPVDRPPGPGGAPPRGPPPGRRGPRAFPPLPAIVGTLLASLAAAALLAWYVAKPIRGLRQAFAAASRGELDHRLGPAMAARDDELADLGREFDRMASQLQAVLERQRRLLHDVSHEVRSPLARLQAALGLLRQSAASRDMVIGRIEEEIARIDRLIGELLRLSRLEAGEHAEQIEDIDMRELVGQVVSDARFESQGAAVEISWKDGAGAMVRGRPEMLRVALDNVVRNALKYGAVGRAVVIDTSAAGARYLFRVLDDGPGVSEQELDKLFTPFFRSNDAASAEGYGLGLAIAKRSIEAHGGAIHASNRPTGGLMVEIELPVAADPLRPA
jgi:two-component system OmpR family sensor kinase